MGLLALCCANQTDRHFTCQCGNRSSLKWSSGGCCRNLMHLLHVLQALRVLTLRWQFMNADYVIRLSLAWALDPDPRPEWRRWGRDLVLVG